nr:entericidin A/B family lipoprotein [Collimonas arenae]
MRKVATLCVLLVAGMVMSACNTVHGFGQDMERVGEKIQGK